jgi:thiosulfate/3-mercaptopyruvate sulfurtransferase
VTDSPNAGPILGPPEAGPPEAGPPEVGPPVVEPAWLAAHYDDVVVADVRWYLDGRSGYDAYSRRHLPRAVFVDLDRCLSGPPGRERGRHPLPSPADFAAAMATLGISDQSRVIAYDDDGGRIAARLVWLLRVTGHASSLLDGGIEAWPGPFESGPFESGPFESGPFESGPLENGPAAPGTRTFNLEQWPAARFASAEEVEAAAVVLDARAPERFTGEVEPVDARAGHIPGARNAPTVGNLDEQDRFKSPEALRTIYERFGVGPACSPVVYCGSGVTACHDLIALELAGFEAGRLYAGSWSQWSADPARAVETGE